MEQADFWVNIHAHQVLNIQSITVLNVYTGAEWDLELSRDFFADDIVFYSVGIHPWNIGKLENQSQTLNQLAAHPKVIAIGECGFDINTLSPLSLQETVFRQHIELSEALHKPLIIHCVRAFNELIRIRKESRSVQPWIVHGFNANETIAHQCLQHNMLLSFGKSLLNENSKAAVVARWIPESEVFLETDDTDLDILLIYKAYASIKQVSVDKLKIIIADNFCKYFKI
ncbi:MAG: TatD family hydrolase [Bacteroidota bacterium]|nr:TatD family hydrolase [Bacteroidota bacterium]